MKFLDLSLKELCEHLHGTLEKIISKVKDTPWETRPKVVKEVFEVLEIKKGKVLNTKDIHEFMFILLIRLERALLKKDKFAIKIRSILRYLYDIRDIYWKPKRIIKSLLHFYLDQRLLDDYRDDIDFLEEVSKDLVYSLKMPDPIFLVDRLKENKPVYILSRIDRSFYINKLLALVNEKLKDLPSYLFGLVTIERGKIVNDVIQLRGQVDNITYLEFLEEKNFNAYKLRAIELHDIEKLEATPRGRRFASFVEVNKSFREEEILYALNPLILNKLDDDILKEIYEDIERLEIKDPRVEFLEKACKKRNIQVKKYMNITSKDIYMKDTEIEKCTLNDLKKSYLLFCEKEQLPQVKEKSEYFFILDDEIPKGFEGEEAIAGNAKGILVRKK